MPVKPFAVVILLLLPGCLFDDGDAPLDQTLTAEAAEKLTWPRPTLTNPTVWRPKSDDARFEWTPTFRRDQDVVIKLPTTRPLRHGIGVQGGRNIVIIGGAIHTADAAIAKTPEDAVAIKARGWTGEFFVEGLDLVGSDAINVDARVNGAVSRRSILTVQNVRAACHAGESDEFHGDCLQTWAGPALIRVDRLTAVGAFQGLMLDPLQDAQAGLTPRADLRRVNIDVSAGSSYCFNVVERAGWELSGSELYGTNPTRRILFGTDDIGVTEGKPAGGDFVRAGSVGVDYRSPE